MQPSDPTGFLEFPTDDLRKSRSYVYPNPIISGSSIQIENRGTASIDQIVITNSKGQLLYTHFSDGLTTSIPSFITRNFSSEVVFVKVVFSDGNSEVHKVLMSN